MEYRNGHYNMTITVGSSGGGGLIMPQGAGIVTASIRMKTAQATETSADQAAFWAAIDVSHTPAGYESTKLAAAANTTEQTILDITDAGVLTQVIAPELSGAGTMTVRVTVDGTLSTFVSETLATGQRFFVGHLEMYAGEASAANGIGIGSNNDEGWGIVADRQLIPTPLQTLSIGTIGMAFTTSLKVTIQPSVNPTGTANKLNACACYALTVPVGV